MTLTLTMNLTLTRRRPGPPSVHPPCRVKRRRNAAAVRSSGRLRRKTKVARSIPTPILQNHRWTASPVSSPTRVEGGPGSTKPPPPNSRPIPTDSTPSSSAAASAASRAPRCSPSLVIKRCWCWSRTTEPADARTRSTRLATAATFLTPGSTTSAWARRCVGSYRGYRAPAVRRCGSRRWAMCPTDTRTMSLTWVKGRGVKRRAHRQSGKNRRLFRIRRVHPVGARAPTWTATTRYSTTTTTMTSRITSTSWSSSRWSETAVSPRTISRPSSKKTKARTPLGTSA